jgi:hypothetical protein
MKFYADTPNLHIIRQRLVGNRTEHFELCVFDENGEVETEDKEVIRQLINIYRHEETPIVEEVEKVEKVEEIEEIIEEEPIIEEVIEGPIEEEPTIEGLVLEETVLEVPTIEEEIPKPKRHCKKCDFACDTQGELLQHYKTAHPKK